MPEVEVLRVEYDAAAAEANAEQYRRKLEQVEARINDLRDAMERGATLADAHYARSMAELTAELDRLRAGEERARRAIEEHHKATVEASAATRRFAKDTAAGAGEATRGLSALHYQMFTIGHLLDDLQYVPEQGLRPIIGQLFQIHPALGLIALGVDQCIRNWERIEAAVKGSAIEEHVTLYGHYFRQMAESIGLAKSEAESLKEEAKAAGEAVAKMQGAGAKERTQAFQQSIEEFGGGESVVRMLLDRDKKANPRRTAEAEKALRDQLNIALARGAGGDQAAIEQIVRAAGERSTFSQSIGTNTETFRRQVRELEAQKSRDQAEAEQANRERQQRIDERARALAGREIGERIAGGEVVRTHEVQQDLAASGVEVDDATADEIRRKVAEIIDEEAAKRALEKGQNRVEARAGIVQEREERRRDERQADEGRIFKDAKVIEEDDAEERKAIARATAGFAAQAQLGIVRAFGDRSKGGFFTAKQQADFREDLREEIVRATRENLLDQGVDPARAGELAERAPKVLSEDLQERALNLQARGLDGQQQTQALVLQLQGIVAQMGARLDQVGATNRQIEANNRTLGNGSRQNRARYP